MDGANALKWGEIPALSGCILAAYPKARHRFGAVFIIGLIAPPAGELFSMAIVDVHRIEGPNPIKGTSR
jgi:hypothetical protein